MRDTFLPYNQPHLTDHEKDAIIRVLDSKWITRGPQCAAFESALSEKLAAPVVAVSSCTAALHLALLISNIGPGDEVITTPLTFAASVNVITHVGARPVLVDINPRTGNIDPEQVERAIGPKTRAILPVHYGGYPVDMKAINRLRDAYHLTVIEDAAHALDTYYEGRPIGSWGNLTAFSFYATKNLTTGEGGALVVPDAELVDQVRTYSLHGLSLNAWNRYSEKGSWHYDVDVPGYKYNMTDIEAALGLVQLQKLPLMQARRSEIARHYHHAFAELPVILPSEPSNGQHAWHLYALRVKAGALRGDRDDIIEGLTQRNIGTSVHFIPIHQHRYYRRTLGYQAGDFPYAEEFFHQEISLPLYPGMTDGDVNDVIAAVTETIHAWSR